eukprot:CAMPEP_0185161994 /NCGR_PEP_ID=MMETSP1139-20130426/5858_1 /TAXON_ID=298111 /ORGANISM="Pavlova sp., Strain CCMP459" /LENGTH=139 /DNA_ID=CAMNT_0027727295 /DNA_START=832 /DNA_END=1248 /DNA_ORIENTATION=-
MEAHEGVNAWDQTVERCIRVCVQVRDEEGGGGETGVALIVAHARRRWVPLGPTRRHLLPESREDRPQVRKNALVVHMLPVERLCWWPLSLLTARVQPWWRVRRRADALRTGDVVICALVRCRGRRQKGGRLPSSDLSFS